MQQHYMKTQSCGFFVLLVILYCSLAIEASLQHYKWNAMINAFRFLQETMLHSSMERAKLNNGIFFECRKTSNRFISNASHFNLNLGDMRGFKRLDPQRKLALFLHGWNDEASKEWVQDLLRTWTHFEPNYNVCVVDWGHLSQSDYKSATMSIFEVGLTVAGIIMALEKLRPFHFSRSNVTIAGYSLGAHAAGYAGSILNGEIEQIIALDPAGPLFSMPSAVSIDYRLDQSDAQFVQVLHTAGGTLGSTLKSGHADFYPNGGTAPQQNCQMFMGLEDMQDKNPISCSHSSAPIFFKQSMDPEYPFIGLDCDSYEHFLIGYCVANRRARFGIHSMRKMEGDFYFITGPQKPYVQRIPGAVAPWRRLNAKSRRFRHLNNRSGRQNFKLESEENYYD